MTKKILTDNWVANFLNYLNVEKNYSPLTLKSYAGDIALFEDFFLVKGLKYHSSAHVCDSQ